jgi:hypothetical protein
MGNKSILCSEISEEVQYFIAHTDPEIFEHMRKVRTQHSNVENVALHKVLRDAV